MAQFYGAGAAELSQYLDGYFITDAKLTGILDGLKATSASYGIETADDVTEEAVRQVPGFGPARTNTLVSWRRSLESDFKSTSAPVSSEKRSSIKRPFEPVRRKLERKLKQGLTALEGWRDQFRKKAAAYEEIARPAAEKREALTYIDDVVAGN